MNGNAARVDWHFELPLPAVRFFSVGACAGISLPFHGAKVVVTVTASPTVALHFATCKFRVLQECVCVCVCAACVYVHVYKIVLYLLLLELFSLLSLLGGKNAAATFCLHCFWLQSPGSQQSPFPIPLLQLLQLRLPCPVLLSLYFSLRCLAALLMSTAASAAVALCCWSQ